MALTAHHYQLLNDAGLVDHFETHRGLYAEMAREAYAYTSRYVTAAGLPVRVDDVIDALESAVRVTEPLRSVLAEKKLREKYWPRRFGDLILDRLWEEISADGGPEQQGPDD